MNPNAPEARRSLGQIVRGSLLLAVVLTCIVLLPFVIIVGHVPVPTFVTRTATLWAMLIFVGPWRFQPALALVQPGWFYIGLWALVAVVFGILTPRLSTRRVFGFAIATVFAGILLMQVIAEVGMAADWRRKADADVHRIILSKTPLGSSMQYVAEVIRGEGWELRRVDYERGFLDQRSRPARESGVKHIQANLGDYQGFPFEVNVTVFWGFNQAERLVDVWVWQTANGL